MNPNALQQLGLVPAIPPRPDPASIPMPPAPYGGVTADQVRQIVDQRLQETMPRLQNTLASFEAIFQRALSADDYAAFHKYVAAGSPGFNELLAGDKLHPIAQLLWETIKENAS